MFFFSWNQILKFLKVYFQILASCHDCLVLIIYLKIFLSHLQQFHLICNLFYVEYLIFCYNISFHFSTPFFSPIPRLKFIWILNLSHSILSDFHHCFTSGQLPSLIVFLLMNPKNGNIPFSTSNWPLWSNIQLFQNDNYLKTGLSSTKYLFGSTMGQKFIKCIFT